MSITQLIDSIMINPTVHISPSYRDTGLHASYTFQPLSNLVYTRDQQVHTAQCPVIVFSNTALPGDQEVTRVVLNL